MFFGTRLHKAIEEYHKYGRQFFDDDLQDFLDEYMAEYDRDFQTCEEFWKLPLLDTDVQLSLKIDLVKNDMLIEHKTSSTPYSQEFLDGQRQVTAYSWAWHQLYTEKEKNIRFNIFITQPKLGSEIFQVMDTTRSEEDFAEWEIWVREILDGIAADYFEPKKARWHNYEECPYYKERV